jgi:alcohol dehydrogenase YqhD (iron-dependent ADH family)
MENFRFENTTKIVFGHDAHKEIGSYIKTYSDKILFVYGRNSIKNNNLYFDIIDNLKKPNVTAFELPGVTQNPTIQLVYEGINICKSNNISFILAVGGGSVIDTAKAIALGTEYTGDVWDFFDHKASLKSSNTKIGVIVTIPGSGSESSASTVISNDINGTSYKRDYSSNLLRPCFALLNPDLTMTLSEQQTMFGGVDILSHVMERYFTKVKNVELTDRMCEAVIVTVINNLRILMKEPNNYNARAEIMWASTIAHNNLLSTGRRSDWASHMIEHELSALYNIPHGAGMAIIFPAWMKYVSKNNPEKFTQFAHRIWSIKTLKKNNSVNIGIDKLEFFFSELNLATRLSSIGIDNANFYKIADNATKFGPLGDFQKIDRNDVIRILELAL